MDLTPPCMQLPDCHTPTGLHPQHFFHSAPAGSAAARPAWPPGRHCAPESCAPGRPCGPRPGGLRCAAHGALPRLPAGAGPGCWPARPAGSSPHRPPPGGPAAALLVRHGTLEPSLCQGGRFSRLASSFPHFPLPPGPATPLLLRLWAAHFEASWCDWPPGFHPEPTSAFAQACPGLPPEACQWKWPSQLCY